MEGKIIGVGFQKTGTSTLREALKILGFRVRDTTPRALIPILRGNFRKIRRMLRGYDAMEDTPWFMIYKELDKMYPGSKFILTVRDADSWYASVTKHIGDLRAAHHEWIYGRGKGLPAEDRDHTISVYNNHNEAVMQYFEKRPEDLLVLDFTQGDRWDKLCAFLGKDVPELPFPHYNKSSEMAQNRKGWKSRFRKSRHRFKNTLKIRLIDLMGWWKV